MTRIDRLSADAKRLLQVAAVIGPEISASLLRALVGPSEEDFERHMWDLQRREFLYQTRLTPEPLYTFKDTLSREVAYQSMLRQTRQHYHLQVAQVLVERFPDTVQTHPELLVRHYTEAGPDDQALAYWRLAGEWAVERSAHPVAIGHFTSGLDVLTTLTDACEWAQHERFLQIA